MALDEPKNWVSLFGGLAVIALGAIPLLASWGVLAWNLPDSFLGLIPAIAMWLVAGVGAWMLINSIHEDDTERAITAILSIVFIALGVIEILHSFAVISWGIPFLNETVYYILFVIEGLFLIVAAFAML